MAAFLLAAFSFPAVVFTFLLVVVAGYWVLVLLGLSDVDAVAAPDPERLTIDHVPLSVTLSVATAIAWANSLAGHTLLADPATPLYPATLRSLVVFAVALLVAAVGTRAAIPLLAPLFPDDPARLVGRDCVIRSGRVDGTFGQAEVTAPDGTPVLVQVRTDHPLRTGATAVLRAYDRPGRFFWLATP